MRSSATTQDRLSQFKGKNVLVTGGAGFVGSNVSQKLIDYGANVTVLDDLHTGREELLPKGLKEFVRQSVTDADALTALVEDKDYVFHLSARVLINSTKDIYSDYLVNIGGMLNLLLAVRDMSGPRPMIVYSSTTSVYGNPRALPSIEEEPTNILSPYAASKFAAESYCNAFMEMYELPIVIVRYSNVYGPHQSPRNPYCGVISKFLEACMKGTAMGIHGSGMQTRDFTFIDDAVTATLLAAVTPRAVGGVFNIGSGFETNIRELARLIAEAAGVSPQIEFIDRRDIDNVQRRVVNIEKARRVLRWQPEVTLDQGLRRTYEWLKGYIDVDPGEQS